MLNHKLDFSSCAWKPGFVKSSHIYIYILLILDNTYVPRFNFVSMCIIYSTIIALFNQQIIITYLQFYIYRHNY